MSWIETNSTWTPIQNAHPYQGTIGEISIEKEIRLELYCEEENIQSIVQTIKDNHPYEEPEIDLYPIELL